VMIDSKPAHLVHMTGKMLGGCVDVLYAPWNGERYTGRLR